MENRPFPPFSRLPPELRIHIWHFSSLVPRVVPLQLRCQQSPRRDSYGDSDVFALCHPPALLSVNREARSTALETYVLAFSTPTSPGVYFSYAHDTLCIPYSFCTSYSFCIKATPPPGIPRFFDSFASTLALVKNIALSGVWAPHAMKLYRIGPLNDTYAIIGCFKSRERFIFLHDTGAVGKEWRIVDMGRADEGQGEAEELREWMEWMDDSGADLYATGQIIYEYGTLVAADQRETPFATSGDSGTQVVGRKRWYKCNIPKPLLHKLLGRRA